MKPRIAITLWRRELPTLVGERTLLYRLADEYVTSTTDVGGLPLLVPHLRDEQEADAVLDGVIEGVEPVEGDWPLLAVQWHPEKLEGEDRRLFEVFVEQARAHDARPATAVGV